MSVKCIFMYICVLVVNLWCLKQPWFITSPLLWLIEFDWAVLLGSSASHGTAEVSPPSLGRLAGSSAEAGPSRVASHLPRLCPQGFSFNSLSFLYSRMAGFPAPGSREEEPQRASGYQSFTCTMLANVLLAQANHSDTTTQGVNTRKCGSWAATNVKSTTVNILEYKPPEDSSSAMGTVIPLVLKDCWMHQILQPPDMQ